MKAILFILISIFSFIEISAQEILLKNREYTSGTFTRYYKKKSITPGNDINALLNSKEYKLKYTALFNVNQIKIKGEDGSIVILSNVKVYDDSTFEDKLYFQYFTFIGEVKKEGEFSFLTDKKKVKGKGYHVGTLLYIEVGDITISYGELPQELKF